MPRKCCVPECKSNYATEEIYVPVFTFPSDEERRKTWIRKIPRENLVVTKNTGVCILHFQEDKIIRENRIRKPDGSELVLPRKKLELSSDAVPTIFPNLPKYLSTVTSTEKRTDPEERREQNIERENERYAAWLKSDCVSSVKEFVDNTEKYNHNNWILKENNSKVYFLYVLYDISATLNKVLVLDSNLNVYITSDNISINAKKFEYILGKELKCDSYSKLENLLTAMKNLDKNKIDISDNVKHIQSVLEECINMTEDKNMRAKFKFLSEQLQLSISKQLRYPPDLLLTSCTFFFFFPAAYRYFRKLNLIFLPHPSYLKTFNLSSVTSGINEPLKKYLTAKFQSLQSHENLVSLLLDEIYVKPKISYKGNRLVGAADNSSELTAATAVQTFMLKSILSKNKDIVALLPVKHLDGECLHQYTTLILKLLSEIGYRVICLVADNNKVNDKLYRILSKSSTIQPYVPHPFNNSEILFLLFDTVHILKNFRNNWKNEKFNTFIYPSFQDVNNIKLCEFKNIIDLYKQEKHLVVKQAPGINYKVCYPNSLEKQNVNYVVPLFEDKTIAAVENLFGQIASGTSEWLQIIRNWWMTVNVKHPHKGIRLRDKYAEPIRNMEQENLKYLKSFCVWLENWNDLLIVDSPKCLGKLSKETFSAALHTTKTLILLCDHLLNDHKLHYVLLGAFQTDDLERRFGQYRKMSGCNYHVSVQQIIESERKLKVTSLLKFHSESFHVPKIIAEINACADLHINRMLLDDEGEDILIDSYDIEIDESSFQVLIFLAGYVSFKISGSLKCSDCKNNLITDKPLPLDLPPELKYISSLDRGGLKYPADLSLHVGICIYKIFQSLMSKKYEQKFIQCDNPKSLLKTLTLEELETQYCYKYCLCGRSVTDILSSCTNVWCNILLNNYSKIKTNDIIEENALKSKKSCDAAPPSKKSRKLLVFNSK